jgi:hypothetical protein
VPRRRFLTLSTTSTTIDRPNRTITTTVNHMWWPRTKIRVIVVRTNPASNSHHERDRRLSRIKRVWQLTFFGHSCDPCDPSAALKDERDSEGSRSGRSITITSDRRQYRQPDLRTRPTLLGRGRAIRRAASKSHRVGCSLLKEATLMKPASQTGNLQRTPSIQASGLASASDPPTLISRSALARSSLADLSGPSGHRKSPADRRCFETNPRRTCGRRRPRERAWRHAGRPLR